MSLDNVNQDDISAANKLAEYATGYVARSSLSVFARGIDRTFQIPPHIQRIINILEQVERGEIKRLIVTLPPRHGKTQLISKIFPAWVLGRNPRRRIIQAGYNQSLSIDCTTYVRNVIANDFIFRTAFPDCILSDDTSAKNHFSLTMHGGLIAAGIGTGITGRGFEIGIIDDPIKNFAESRNKRLQQSIWDWYLSTFYTRSEPDAAIIICLTRWVKDDLVGRLLESQGNNDWTVVRFPALNESGKALWPERYPADKLFAIRSAITEPIFQALYQQSPVDTVNQLFDAPIFTDASETNKDVKLSAWLDPAFGGSDYNALVLGGFGHNRVDIAGRSRRLFYVRAGFVWRGQVDYKFAEIRKIIDQYDVRRLWVETNAAQILLIKSLRDYGINAAGKKTVQNKYAKIYLNVRQNWPIIRFDPQMSDSNYLRQLLQYNEFTADTDAADALASLIGVLQSQAGSEQVRLRYS